MKDEKERTIIYELKKRRWVVSTRFARFEKMLNSTRQTPESKLQTEYIFWC